MKIAIIGTGAYSVALAKAISKKCNNIMMWTESDQIYSKYLDEGLIRDIIPNTQLPSFIKLTRDYKQCVEDAEVVFIAAAAPFIESICTSIKPYISSFTSVCIASKGIYSKNCSFLSDEASNILGINRISVISGPSFAIDMFNDNPIGLTIAGIDKDSCDKVINILSNDELSVKKTTDLIGVQLCGSIKNVIAIASGMISGLGYSESTQCLLITEALNDIKNLIISLGGDKDTVLTYAGVGDLLLTCTSTKSRNFSFGYLIGETKDKDKIIDYLKKNTVEGHYTLGSIYKIIKNKGIDVPIIDLIYKIVYEYDNPQELIDYLMNRS